LILLIDIVYNIILIINTVIITRIFLCVFHIKKLIAIEFRHIYWHVYKTEEVW